MRNLAKYTNRPNPPDSENGVSHLDVAKLLLDKGANANAEYTKTVPPRQAQGNINVAPGSTPLYRAVRAVDLASVKLLVDAGANPSLAIKDGSTPTDGCRRARRAARRRRRGHRGRAIETIRSM